jgi:hypothetical protein
MKEYLDICGSIILNTRRGLGLDLPGSEQEPVAGYYTDIENVLRL